MFFQWLFSYIFCYCLPTCKLICGLPCSKGWPCWLPHFIFCSALPCNEIFYYAENCVLAIWNLFQDNSTWLSNTYSFIMVHRFFIVMWLMAEVHHLLVQVPQPKIFIFALQYQHVFYSGVKFKKAFRIVIQLSFNYLISFKCQKDWRWIVCSPHIAYINHTFRWTIENLWSQKQNSRKKLLNSVYQ